MSTMLLLSIGILILILGSILVPEYLQVLMHGGSWSVAALVAISVSVVYWVHAPFGKYEKTPGLAREFLSSESRRWSLVAFWSVIVAVLVVMILTLGHF
jgi:hypothetical protein